MLAIFLFFIMCGLIAGAAVEVFPLILEALWVVATVIIEVLVFLITWLWKRVARYFQDRKDQKQRQRWYEQFEQQQKEAEAKRTPVDYRLACQLLGLPVECRQSEFKLAFRRAMLKAHPDKNGSVDAAQKLNRAREIIRQRRGW